MKKQFQEKLEDGTIGKNFDSRHEYNFDEELQDFDAVPLKNCKQRKHRKGKRDTGYAGYQEDKADILMKPFIKILNSLRHDIKVDETIMQHSPMRDDPAAKYVLQEKSRKIIYDLFNKDKFLININNVLRIGENYISFHVHGNVYEKKGEEYLMKVYKSTELAREEAREHWNLCWENLSHPETLILKDHILISNFIGKFQKEKYVFLGHSLPHPYIRYAYPKITTAMQMIYRHRKKYQIDLPETKGFWHEKKCYLEVWRQMLDTNIPDWQIILLKDCRNITNYFKKNDVRETIPAKALFEVIVGKSYEEVTKS